MLLRFRAGRASGPPDGFDCADEKMSAELRNGKNAQTLGGALSGERIRLLRVSRRRVPGE
jgi:hypothetical protein